MDEDTEVVVYCGAPLSYGGVNLLHDRSGQSVFELLLLPAASYTHIPSPMRSPMTQPNDCNGSAT